jgi:hypothetical protein
MSLPRWERRRPSTWTTRAIVAGALSAFIPGMASAVVCSALVGTNTVPVASPGGDIFCGPGQIESIGLTSNSFDTLLQLTPNLQVNAGGVSLTSTGAQNLGVIMQAGAGGTGGFVDASGTAFDGIFVSSGGGNVTVNLTIPVTGGVDGIEVLTSGYGAASVTVFAPITAGTGAGIVANSGAGGGPSTTSLDLELEARVAALQNSAIVTNAGAGGTINIAPGVLIEGLGQSTSTTLPPPAVIDATTVSGSTTTITNKGTVRSTTGLSLDLAIRSNGLVTVNNAGSITGRLDISGVPIGSSVRPIFNNGLPGEGSGVWTTSGLSNLAGAVFNNGAATPSGTATGLIVTGVNGANTTLDFGSATPGVINNNPGGVFIVGQGPFSGVAKTVLLGAETFNNNGVIILGSNGGSGSDSLRDAILLANATTMTGSGLIEMDANLWRDIQSATDCQGGTLPAGDCVVLGGTAPGTHIGLRITDTGAHPFGAYNPTGIVLVTGASSASAIHIDPSSTWFTHGGTNEFGGATDVLNKPGLFFYDLLHIGQNTALVGVPKAPVFEFAALGGAVTDLWHMTTQTWFDRQADLRVNLDHEAGANPAVWLKFVGDWVNRDKVDRFDIISNLHFDTSYNQDTSAILGGVDLLDVTGKDRAFVVGLEGGGVNSGLGFKASPDHYTLSGGDFGGYATFLSGGLFIDGTINANFLTLHGNLPGLTAPTSLFPSTLIGGHVNVVGGQIESGYRMPITGTWFWEPVGSLAYSKATFDQIQLPGALAQLTHAESLQGSLGARIGGVATFQFGAVEAAIETRVLQEFKSGAVLTLQSDGSPFSNADDLKGTSGEVKADVNVFSNTSGLSAFLNGGWRFKANYSEGTITLGARYQW